MGMGMDVWQVQSAIEAVAALVSEHLSVAPSATCVVVGGAGTSGRLAYFVTRAFNRLMKSHGRLPCFRHCIAGGDTALFKSVEGAEDDPAGAVDDLKVRSPNPDP
jgi:N-acetylmuramic acid 6-phosphate (MurNAc-6-P) etherase